MTAPNPYQSPETSSHWGSDEAMPAMEADVSTSQAELVHLAQRMRRWQFLILLAVAITAVRWIWVLAEARIKGAYYPLSSPSDLVALLWCVSLVWIVLQLALVIRASSLLRPQGRRKRVRRFCRQLALLCLAACSYLALSVLNEVQTLIAMLFPNIFQP